MVADGSITNNPVFNRDFSPMLDGNASEDDQWLAVAKYDPSVNLLWNHPSSSFRNGFANSDRACGEFRLGVQACVRFLLLAGERRG